MEVTVALGVAVFLSLLVMRGSLLALSGNQWTVMQTLSEAFMTRETALSNRIPMSDLIASPSRWPDQIADNPPYSVQSVTLGVLPGGKAVQARLTRFRTNETPANNTDVTLIVWRLYSVLTFNAGDQAYVKTRTTLRTQ
jgi:hypothetical protein